MQENNRSGYGVVGNNGFKVGFFFYSHHTLNQKICPEKINVILCIVFVWKELYSSSLLCSPS